MTPWVTWISIQENSSFLWPFLSTDFGYGFSNHYVKLHDGDVFWRELNLREL